MPQLTETERDVVDRARRFAADTIAPNAALWERQRHLPREVLAAAGEMGLCRLLVPADLGGLGISFSALVKLMEEDWPMAIWPPLSPWSCTTISPAR